MEHVKPDRWSSWLRSGAGSRRAPAVRALGPMTVALLCSLFLATPGRASVVISDVRVWPGPEYTRITFESARPIEYTVFTMRAPERLVLDLEDVTLDAQLEALPGRIGSDDPYIAQIRVARNRSSVVRLVLELRGEIKPQTFSLKPVGNYGHRLVVDVYPAHPADPIMTLLQELEKGKQPDVRQAGLATPKERDGQADVDGHGTPPPPVASLGKGPAPPELESGRPQGKASRTRKAMPNRDAVRLVTIAIDAGHGGEDPGAKGRYGTYEKDVTLAIARKLKALVDAEPGMRGLLIRDGDYFVPLKERVEKAQKVRADLFVSIHADAYIKPHARGSSVFALSERGATSVAAGWWARRSKTTYP